MYHLLNLKIIPQEKLLEEQARADQANALLGVPLYLEQETLADLKQMTVNLIVEAWLQDQIAHPKAYEYMNLLGLDPRKLDSLNIKA